MGVVSRDFYARVLRGIGAPINGSTMRACVVWQAAEGGSARNNPWNTTQPTPNATKYNSVGVRNYPNLEEGARATIETLLNGNYPHVLAEFRRGKNGLSIVTAVGHSPWGTSLDLVDRIYRERYS